jgi:hypothetical protein
MLINRMDSAGGSQGVPNVQFAFNAHNDSVPATGGNGLLGYYP